MVMKNRIITNSFRNIKKSLPRFISLMVISMLGVFVFSGLLSTSPDMLNTLDTFLDEHNTYDFKIISTLGLNNNDIEALSNIEGVKDVESSYSKDLLVKLNDDEETIFNISSLPLTINTLDLLDGKLPQNDNEIVVENNFLVKNNYKIGDKILLDDTFKEDEVIIVGSVRSSLYYTNTKINQNRGSTSIGSGIINYYAFVLPSNFNQDYYTSIYITLDEAINYITNSKEYNDIIDNVKEKIDDIKATQEKQRYDEVYDDALKIVKDNETEVNKELDKAWKEITSSQNKLTTAKKQLDNSKKSLNSYNQQLINAKKQLDSGKKAYNDTLKQYNLKENELQTKLNEVNQNINTLNTQLALLTEEMPEYQKIVESIKTLNQNKALLENLINTKNNLTNSENEYNKNNNNYKNLKSTYDKSLATYNSNLTKLNNAKKEYNENKEKLEEEIASAYEELKNIELPTWYINDRNSYQTYADYINDTDSITDLSKIFPLVFFAVAILVSLISMNRMVEDDRNEIGTLKSLGFKNKEISTKYLLFSLLSTLIGSLLGIILGCYFIPTLIFNIYGMLFDIPNFKIGFNLKINLLSFGLAILCIVGTTLITVNKVLKEKPSMLMRPKPPKNGKRVFLEKWKFLWNKLKFSQKVIIRNLFRYKKRALVTIIGIAGCTSLVLCGFGLKDAIVDINEMQYGKTFKFDNMIYVNNLDEEKIQDIVSHKYIKDKTSVELISAKISNTSINLFVSEDAESLNKVVNLIDRETKENVKLTDNEVIITDKLADLENIKVNDTITLLDNDNNSYEFKVGYIVDNYIGHYVYVSKNLYESLKYSYKPNIVYTNTKELSEEEKDELSQALLSNEEIRSITYKDELMESVDNMLKSLDKVVVILIILAALLSFVVLYNLSNININERKREIATLKVLGFYDNEVDIYVTRENIIFTIIGILLGLFLGTFLTEIVIKTVEMDMARFIHEISINSYLYAAIISLIFTIIVDRVTHFALKKIDMIESLKSVE